MHPVTFEFYFAPMFFSRPQGHRQKSFIAPEAVSACRVS
jgi:hypothetical protein